MPKRVARVAIIVAVSLVALTAAVLVGLIVGKRLKTGEWSMPDGQDLVEIKRVFISPGGPPKTIYLHRGPITILTGREDSHSSSSSILPAGQSGYQLPGFSGKDKTWQSILACVRDQFAAFDVRVVEQRPAESGYILVAVGGRPKDIGMAQRRIGGLAPFNSEVIPNAVVFAFARELGNRVRVTCETIAMEVAHAYGLDHEYLCKDSMTYLTGCGNKSFVDKDARCGEKKARDCANGKPTQNSYRQLLSVLGAAKPTQAGR